MKKDKLPAPIEVELVPMKPLPVRAGFINHLKRIWNGKCSFCKKEDTSCWTMNLFMPLSKGGIREESNLVLACTRCNQLKGDKDPYEWMKFKKFTFIRKPYMDK
jgi:5-methylcytosine-specific restriction endonuclease McrA